MSGGAPGPLRRLLRQPLRAGALVLLGVTALAASGIHSAAALALRDQIDANWRGAYDILVTADGVAADGLLAPNTLSADAAMGTTALDAVRAVDGVEVAAPIGEVLIPGVTWGSAQLLIPFDEVPGLEDGPQTFRITATYSTDDGLGERLVDQRSFELVVDGDLQGVSEEDIAACLASDISTEVDGRTLELTDDYPALRRAFCEMGNGSAAAAVIGTDGTQFTYDNGSSATPDRVQVGLPSAPQTMTRLTLIDPAAEQELLGDAGDFLQPLVDLAPDAVTDVTRMQEWAQQSDSPYATGFQTWVAAQATASMFGSVDDEALADERRLYRDNGLDFDAEATAALAGTGFVPVLVAEQDVADLHLKIDVTAVGTATRDDTTGLYTLPAETGAGTDVGVSIGSSAADVSALLTPFSTRASGVVWPGATGVIDEDENGLAANSPLRAVGRLAAARYSEADGEITLSPEGFVTPLDEGRGYSDLFGLGEDGTALGAESAYSSGNQVWAQGEGGYSYVQAVGTFDTADIDTDEDAANHVPLGAYGVVGSTVVDGAHAGTTMQPSLSGLGLVSSRTAAIGSFASAGIWGDDTPISAIRVRVSGIEGYDERSQQRVVEVAQRIEDLGLAATIVAGSSPVDTDVFVEDYAFGTAQ
ncbi:MAG: hypothetical protein QM677_04420, partial [Microbacterium sp.]